MADFAAAITRRGVVFSPRNDTKYFNSSDSIIPSSDPPKSIRSYHDSDFESPSSSRSYPKRSLSALDYVRPILKSRVHEIRIAASVEEGTMGNKEAARLLVSGQRPKLVARDSFQLAMTRRAAATGSTILPPTVKASKGSEAPGSDDSIISDEAASIQSEEEARQWASGGGSSDEEEETLEQDGPLATASLVKIILDGAEDLLTLEEAYTTLTLRLRHKIPVDGTKSQPCKQLEESRLVIKPIRDDAPAMVRALQRDLGRLMGKVPNSDVPTAEIGNRPFRGLMPLQRDTPSPAGPSRRTPSPTPPLRSPSKPARQGYSESEVRYRREASGVGAAALRFLAFAFHTSFLFSCFSEADQQALLNQIVIIPRTPQLPTPHPKRSYFLAILVFAQLRIPPAAVVPLRDKIVRAVESAIGDQLGAGLTNTTGKESQGQIRKEGLSAVVNLLATYPSIFFPFYADLLPGCLRGLVAPVKLIRTKAAAACAAYYTARCNLEVDLSAQLVERNDQAARDAFQAHRSAAQKSELAVVSHLRRPLQSPNKSETIYGKNGEKKAEWTALEQIFKSTVGEASDVHCACATWATVVSLMGSAYSGSGLAQGLNHIMDVSITWIYEGCPLMRSDLFSLLRIPFDLYWHELPGTTLCTPTYLRAPPPQSTLPGKFTCRTSLSLPSAISRWMSAFVRFRRLLCWLATCSRHHRLRLKAYKRLRGKSGCVGCDPKRARNSTGL